MRSLFGDMFDFNHDGELDRFERTMEYEFLEELSREPEDSEDAGLDPDEYDF